MHIAVSITLSPTLFAFEAVPDITYLNLRGVLRGSLHLHKTLIHIFLQMHSQTHPPIYCSTSRRSDRGRNTPEAGRSAPPSHERNVRQEAPPRTAQPEKNTPPPGAGVSAGPTPYPAGRRPRPRTNTHQERAASYPGSYTFKCSHYLPPFLTSQPGQMPHTGIFPGMILMIFYSTSCRASRSSSPVLTFTTLLTG